MANKLQGGILAGSTSVSLPVELRTAADSTATTGKAYTDVAASYWRQGGVRVEITPDTLAAANSAWASGGFVKVDDTNMPGVYRFDVPDAAFAANADWVVITVVVASSFVENFYFPLTTNVIQTGDSFARIGAPVAASISADIAVIDANVDQIETAVITNAAGDDIAADIIAIKSETATIVADTNELQVDDIPGLIATAQSDLDIITGADGVNLLAATQASIDAIEADTDELQSDDVPTLIAALPTAGENADQVWEEAIADHSGTAGSTAEALGAAGAAGDPWATALPGAYGAGTAGEILGDWKDGERLDLIADSILADTNELQADDTPAAIAAVQATADAVEADTQNIQGRIPAALAGGLMAADAQAISTSTVAADNLEASAETIVIGAAAAGTLSTTQMTTNLTEVTDDHYNGRIIIWTDNVLKDQATDITAYDGATKMLTFTAVTEAPTADDTFCIV